MHEPLPRDDYHAPLIPTRLDLPPTVAPRSAPQFGPRAAFALLGLTVAGVLAVVFWLPRWVAAPSPADAPQPRVAVPVQTAPATADATAAPSMVPEPPEARAAAQEALAALLPSLAALRTQRVAVWGADDLKAIEALVASGEQAYREQRFTAARERYAQATEKVAATVARLPDVIAATLDEGERALLSHDARAAASAFALALNLAPENGAAQRGIKRAESFERVMALLTEAEGYERMQDAAHATATYRAVLDLDPAVGAARQALARLAQAKAEAVFAAKMSQGFAALQDNDFAQATSAFEAARKLRPQASAATNALAQTLARATAAKVENALRAARKAEQHEQWGEAGAQYRAALALDKRLEMARTGDARARQRAALDERLRASVQHPARLADEAVYQEAQRVASEARALTSPGPRLVSQLAALNALLVAARTAVTVTLHSDGATAVTLLKTGELGRFTDHALALFPGRYTAVGTRSGYRDTRVEFTVEAGAAPSITVQCQEALPFGR